MRAGEQASSEPPSDLLFPSNEPTVTAPQKSTPDHDEPGLPVRPPTSTHGL
jgi:hypothetical protein